MQIPNYTIDKVKGAGHSPEDLMVMRFGEYLATREYLFQPHRHSFCHLVYFTRGKGTHSIDFVSFPVRPGQAYFMNPGQVHNWAFAGEVEGYIVNFSPRFFSLFLHDPRYLGQFAFFSGQCREQVIDLPESGQGPVVEIFEKILLEVNEDKTHGSDMIRVLLLQIFLLVSRQSDNNSVAHVHKPGLILLQNFRRLVEEHFLQQRLPKEYAAMLYVTPNYLNALSRDVLGISAGELIRERVILEAKRLLINAGMSISEIAYQLNFQDHSYFTKFFKKYAGVTPEVFRKQINSTE